MSDEFLTEEKPSIFNEVTEYLKDANFEEALRLLQDRLQTNPGDLDTLHLIGTIHAKKGDYIKAEKFFRKELEIDPNREEAHFNLGLIHSKQNRLSEAIEDFENVVRLNPEDVQALNDLGVMYYSKGVTDKSHDLFCKALQVKPTYKDAFLNLFELLWNAGKYNQALEHVYNFLKKLSPADSNRITQPEVEGNKQKVQPEYLKRSLEMRKRAPAIIKPSDSEKLDIFDKHVPQAIKDKKTGMNIAVVADFNIAGQLSQLFRLINEKTIHRARCIIIYDDYLTYDKDIVLSHDKQDDFQTAVKIIENADFFHIGRFPKKVGDLNLLDYLKPNNTIVQYFGSELRQKAKEIYQWHLTNKITGLSAWDYTMLESSPFFYHINIMFDSTKIKSAPKPEGTIKIVHPVTNRNVKRTDLFLEVVDRLRKKYDIEPILIEGKNNQECLELKSQAHMTYDQISVGIYGLSAIESMAAGHVVFGGISNFAASYFPDNPIVWVTEDDLFEKIEHYLINRVQILDRGLAGKSWVKLNHDPDRILRQHLYMYDFVRNGHRFLRHPDEQLLGAGYDRG
ncbi:MAG: hypothetical protein DRP26_00445 [Candidatus Zixiibacteriota bacterium]|nr:MAG: hypothetical protein DRP26_00445 [candidate division Zixibacteria bacterium]